MTGLLVSVLEICGPTSRVSRPLGRGRAAFHHSSLQGVAPAKLAYWLML